MLFRSYERSAGNRPSNTENTLNAWYYKTEVMGASSGTLAGKTVALKDNIALAGVPMMNGAAPLEGFVPSFDATVVTRLLDAGATILGKATCEHYCLSGGSHTSDPAPVHNPHRHGYAAGGSSSGSAALVATGEVDIAVGGDHVTNDLAYGLKVSMGRAEALKLEHGAALVDPGLKGRTIDLPNEFGLPNRTVNLEHLRRIMSARLGEIFEIIAAELEAVGLLDQLRAGVFLCGGGSRIPQIETLGARTFGVPVVLGRTNYRNS